MSDAQIQKMLQKVRDAKAHVEQLRKQSNQRWITTATFMEGKHSSINIQTANAEEVTRIVRYLVVNRNVESEVAEILNIPESNTIQGFSYESWFTDCSKRMATLNLASESAKLEELETRVNNLVSPELRRQMELDELLKMDIFAKDEEVTPAEQLNG